MTVELTDLKLPIVSRDEDPLYGLAFDLLSSQLELVRRLGMVGYIAKGLAITGAGVLIIAAASRSESNKATGLDGALKTLGAQSYGAALLIAAGLGIITYGLYSFTMVRYTKM